MSVHGILKNFNTIEEFKAVDKSALFNELADELWTKMHSESALTDLSYLNKFLLLTFADLKKYKFFYWFAFPAFVAKPAWEIDSRGWVSAEEEIGRESVGARFLLQCPFTPHLPSQLTSIHDSLSNLPGAKTVHPAYFIARPSKASSGEVTYEVAEISNWESFFKEVPEDKVW